MAVPDHTLYTWSGVFGPAIAPIEEWQFSLKAANIQAPTEAVLDGVAQGMETVWTENLRSIMFPDVTLTKCTVVHVDGSGKYETYTDGSYVRGERSVNVSGTSGNSTTVYPLQTALTVSLVTSRPGPTGKGRFFLPFPAVQLDSGHRIGTGQMPMLISGIGEFVRDAKLLQGDLIVASGGTKANGYVGYTSPVTGIRIGRVPDTMRSRRGDLIEAYESVSL